MKIFKSPYFSISVNGMNDLVIKTTVGEPILVDSYPFTGDRPQLHPKQTHSVGKSHGWVVAQHPTRKDRYAVAFELPFQTSREGNDLYLIDSLHTPKCNWMWISESSIVEL